MIEDLDWYDGRRTVVTGGLGFIGANLVLRLDALGADVSVIDAEIVGQGANRANLGEVGRRVRQHDLDLCSDDVAPALTGAEVVFDLAGQVSHIDSMVDPRSDLRNNVGARIGLLDAIARLRSTPTVVYSSTRQVYGRPETLPLKESHPVKPADVNGINKRAAELYHLLHAEAGGWPCVVLRLTNTYGPRQRLHDQRQGFLPTFVRAALDDDEILLWGGGHQVRDVNYVDDVVNALLLAGIGAPERPGRIYNLGADPALDLRRYAEAIVAAAGTGRISEAPWPEDRRRIDVGDAASDHSLISFELGWKSTWTFEAGIAETIRFYRTHPDHTW